jgi:hypothetical protein
MMKRLLKASQIALLLFCAAFSAAEARADVKIKTRQTSGGQVSEGATYIKGKRQRTETGDGQMITIQECDLKRDIQIMPQARAYTVRLYDANTATTNVPAASQTQGTTTKGGLVTSTVTTKDTGERKTMFGYTARHIITTMTTVSSPDACSPVNSKMETDGWYIDAVFALDCDIERAAAYTRPQRSAGCQDRYQTKQIGTAKKGFAVWEKMTMYDAAGSPSYTSVNEVIELSQATLDAALFEIPEGYREVNNFSEAFASSASAYGNSASGDSGNDSSGDSAVSANVKKMANSPQTQGAGALGPKKPGVVRLGLATVKTGSVGDNLNAADLAAAVGNTLSERLKRAGVEVVQITADVPSQIDAEAKQNECDYIVFLNISHKKSGGGGGFGMFSKAASSISSMGAGHTGSTAGNVAGGTATGAAVTAASMSAKVKSKDELTLDLIVQSPGNSMPAAVQQFKSKAKSGGEDIITPAVEQVAQAILGVAAAK